VSIDRGRFVDYVADLVDVQVGPSWRSRRSQKLLSYELPATRREGEGLWSSSVKTLYVIANCRRLNKKDAFPMTQLRKRPNRPRISANYKRSYALVHRHL